MCGLLELGQGLFCPSMCCFLPPLMNYSDLSGFNPITDDIGENSSRSGQDGRNALTQEKLILPQRSWLRTNIENCQVPLILVLCII